VDASGFGERGEFFASAPPDGGEPIRSTRRMDRHVRRPMRQAWALSPVQVLGAAFMLLLGSAGAVALGQFTANHRAPWISIGLSAAAVVCTAIAVLMRPRR
jgi:hypothetical protein